MSKQLDLGHQLDLANSILFIWNQQPLWIDAIPRHIFGGVFSQFWSNELAGLQWKRGGRWKVDQLLQKNIRIQKNRWKTYCFCLPQIEAGLWVVSKYVCGKRGRGGNRRAGQAEVS